MRCLALKCFVREILWRAILLPLLLKKVAASGIQTNDFSLCQIFLKSVIIISILPGIFRTLLSLPSFGVS